MTTGRIALLSVLILLLYLVCAKESISQATECEEGDEACPACVDLDTDCTPLVEDNDCLKSPAYMVRNCRASCGFCSDETKEEYDEDDLDQE